MKSCQNFLKNPKKAECGVDLQFKLHPESLKVTKTIHSILASFFYHIVLTLKCTFFFFLFLLFRFGTWTAWAIPCLRSRNRREIFLESLHHLSLLPRLEWHLPWGRSPTILDPSIIYTKENQGNGTYGSSILQKILAISLDERWCNLILPLVIWCWTRVFLWNQKTLLLLLTPCINFVLHHWKQLLTETYLQCLVDLILSLQTAVSEWFMETSLLLISRLAASGLFWLQSIGKSRWKPLASLSWAISCNKQNFYFL